MDIIAVLKARALAVLEIDGLNKGGKIRFSDLVQPLVDQFKFQSYPTKLEDFDLSDKGVSFESGVHDGIGIDVLKIYNRAIYLDTLASTDESRHILLSLLDWGSQNLGLTYEEGTINRWGYISNLVFRTDFPLLQRLSTPLANLAAKTSEITKNLWGVEYQPLLIKVGHDPMARKFPIANFTIEPRANDLITENRFFSEAPLPTADHIGILQQLENDILRDGHAG